MVNEMLDAVEARALAASPSLHHSPGTTSYYDFSDEMLEKIAEGGPWSRAACVQRLGDGTVLALTGPIDNKQSIDDADFYSHAKWDVLALIKIVRELSVTVMR